MIEKLKQVQIECDTASAVIGRYDGPETMFYVDAPYPQETRYHKKAYRHEMDEAGQRALAAQLHAVEGRVIISSYAGRLYDELYGDWRVVRRHSTDVNGKTRVECLWLNPAYQDVYRLPLFNKAGK